jgi:Zyg-11 protein homolog
MLNLINDRLNRKVFDDVMEVAWSTMWNVTDETPINCERFLDGKGMEYFLGCLRVRHFERHLVNTFYNQVLPPVLPR